MSASVKSDELAVGETGFPAAFPPPALDVAGDLQAHLKQSKPFRSGEEQLFLNVLRTAAVLQSWFGELLREHELTSPQYNVLRILRGAGADGLPSGEIGERMVTRDPDVTRLLDRMERRDLIQRVRGATDRRVVTARLTEWGRQLVNALDAPVAELHRRQLGHLSAGEIETLNTLLERARNESRLGAAGVVPPPPAPIIAS